MVVTSAAPALNLRGSKKGRHHSKDMLGASTTPSLMGLGTQRSASQRAKQTLEQGTAARVP